MISEAADWKLNAEEHGIEAAKAMEAGLDDLAVAYALIAGHFGRLYLGWKHLRTFDGFLSYVVTSCVNGRD